MVVASCCHTSGDYAFSLLPSRWLVAPWRRPRGYLVTVSWLPRDCLVTVPWLSRECLVTVSWLSCECLVTVSWLSRSCLVAVSWLLAECCTSLKRGFVVKRKCRKMSCLRINCPTPHSSYKDVIIRRTTIASVTSLLTGK